MIDKGVARRYAQALFGAAQNTKALAAVLADLEAIESIVTADSSLLRFLESPRELDDAKRSLVERVFTGRAHDLCVRLILLLLRKKRVPHLLDVIASYRRLVEQHEGVAEARVVTAVALEDDLRDAIRRELERVFRKKVRIQPVVDPKVIGGAVVMIEGKILDRSVRHELEKLREELLSVRFH
jgi:F-type H+-transporting ATPase subunit delta